MTMSTTADLCMDCASNASTYTTRSRSLCSSCLQRFISGRVLKRMEFSRTRKEKAKAGWATKTRLFVPLSGGISSLALLAVMTAQIRRQMAKTGRTGYEISVAHVDMHFATRGDREADVSQWWMKLKAQFPECEFLPPVRLSNVFGLDENLVSDLSLLDLHRQSGEMDDIFTERIFASLRTATARTELCELLLKRLLVAMAKANGCEAIIWGHSDTKLAATTLALVAKGRGSAVSGELADGSSLWGMEFNYPLRDLFKPELEIYLQCTAEEVRDCLLLSDGDVRMPVSLKTTSIDSLLGAYIDGQGEKYPSIMANVVRTAGKLQAPDTAEKQQCQICAGQVENESHEQKLCYGCIRMKQDIKT